MTYRAKYSNDTKVFRKFTNDTDKQSLQDDLDKLEELKKAVKPEDTKQH